LDARFRNTTSKPPREGKQAVGPANDNYDLWLSNLKPGESVFDRGRPLFDKGRFVAVISRDYTQGFGGKEPRELGGKNRAGLSGAQLSATCEGAICGGEDSAKITGSPTSYKDLTSKAQTKLNLVAAKVDAPHGLGRLLAAAVMKLKLLRPIKIEGDDGRDIIRHIVLLPYNGRLLPHIFRAWFGQSYPWRWDQLASCYLDIRIDGKASNSADLTWSQAATRIADEALDNFSTQPNRHEGRKCPLIFYEKPFLCIFLFWLMAGLDAPLSDFWLYAAAEPPSTEKKTRRYIPSNIYWRRKEDRRVGELVSLAALLSVKMPRLARYYRECWRRVAEANQDKRPAARTERDKVIVDHWPLVADKCRKVPQAHRADAIQACMERLVKVYDDDWRPELGTFGTFAAQAIDWAIQDFMEHLRRQVPVQRSINLNDPAPADDDEDEKPPTPEQPDMMNLSSLEKQAAAAKRRLIAERLGCLNPRERHVIEGRLALNGYGEAVTHDDLAAELGMDERQIRRIEGAAVKKLAQAVA
jgi:RNA polymerase sigma factor (sigma-70 family)